MQNVRNYSEIKAKEIINPVQCTVWPQLHPLYISNLPIWPSIWYYVFCLFLHMYIPNLFAFIAKNVQAGNFIWHHLHVFFWKTNGSVIPPLLLRECVSMGAANARTSRSLGHHLLHPLILRLLKYGSEERDSSLCRCSILLGFIM